MPLPVINGKLKAMAKRLAIVACTLTATNCTSTQVLMPPVTAHGVTCTGKICGDVLNVFSNKLPQSQLGVAAFEDFDMEPFCAELRATRPPGPGDSECRASNPPLVPGSPGFVSNGCGDGSIYSTIAQEVAGLGLDGYLGDLNHPFPGISFGPACTAHDYCYGTANSTQGACDYGFGQALDDVCNRALAYTSECQAISARLVSAVARLGGDAYEESLRAKTCSLWAQDMTENGCADQRNSQASIRSSFRRSHWSP
ncbi:MAG: hypothetical protein IPK27_23105 [Rhodanobacteraceae bacterium]|nr:hypothetical protein [Rhodanobacteraceae bacterium]